MTAPVSERRRASTITASTEIFSRLGAVETDVAALGEAQKAIAGNLAAVREDVRQQGVRFEAIFAGISAKLDERSRTDWSAILSAVGIGILLAGGLISFVILYNQPQKETLAEHTLELRLLRQQLAEHEQAAAYTRGRHDAELEGLSRAVYHEQGE